MNFFQELNFTFQEYYLVLRLLSCFLLGWWWCVSGSLLQWSTQNPLSCPVTLGITALPVSIWLACYMLGFDAEQAMVYIPVVGILLFLHYVYFKNLLLKFSTGKFFQRDQIIIMGVALNLSLAAFYSFYYFYHSSQGKVMPSSLWFGLLKNMDVTKFATLFFGSIIFLMILKKLLQELSLLSFGKSFAANFVDVSLVEKKMLIFNSALMCLIIFTGGVFAFWGLLLPHLVRRISFFRRSLSLEIYAGGFMAGMIMMIADYMCFEFPLAGSEIPVGLLSSIFGPILLVTLLWKKSVKAV
jgi:iron complex transport system permease protein